MWRDWLQLENCGHLLLTYHEKHNKHPTYWASFHLTVCSDIVLKHGNSSQAEGLTAAAVDTAVTPVMKMKLQTNLPIFDGVFPKSLWLCVICKPSKEVVLQENSWILLYSRWSCHTALYLLKLCRKCFCRFCCTLDSFNKELLFVSFFFFLQRWLTLITQSASFFLQWWWGKEKNINRLQQRISKCCGGHAHTSPHILAAENILAGSFTYEQISFENAASRFVWTFKWTNSWYWIACTAICEDMKGKRGSVWCIAFDRVGRSCTQFNFNLCCFEQRIL